MDETRDKLRKILEHGQKVAFSSDEDKLDLPGILISSDKNRGLIIFCHGRGESKEMFLKRYVDLEARLLNRGLALLFFDFRGHGQALPAKYSFGYYEQRDVFGALRFIKGKFPGKNIGVLGFSLGAAAAMLAVEKDNSMVKALVSESGYSSIEKVAVVPKANGSQLIKGTPEHAQAVNAYKQRQGFNFEISPGKEIDKISPGALLLIDGSAEEEDNQFMFERAKEPKQLWIIPGARHGTCYFIAKEEYDKKVSEFFARYMV